MFSGRKKSKKLTQASEPHIRGWPVSTLKDCVEAISQPEGLISINVNSFEHIISADARHYKNENMMATEAQADLDFANRFPDLPRSPDAVHLLQPDSYEIQGAWGFLSGILAIGKFYIASALDRENFDCGNIGWLALSYINHGQGKKQPMLDFSIQLSSVDEEIKVSNSIVSGLGGGADVWINLITAGSGENDLGQSIKAFDEKGYTNRVLLHGFAVGTRYGKSIFEH
jgi:hypothetical protein